MSARQFFNELEAVAEVLNEHVESLDEDGAWVRMDSETFTALWQAVELLSRAYSVLLPLVAYQEAEARLLYAQGALELPDVKVVEA